MGLLMEHESKNMLERYGIRTATAFFVKSEDEAIETAKKIGYPVVAKVASRKISHKSDAGGVILNIQNQEELIQAFNHLTSIQDAEGVSIQKMVEKGIEAIVGITYDEQFGHVMMFGIGGIFVELYRDVAFSVLPLEEYEIVEMIRSVKGYRMLEGYRGIKGDVESIIELLKKVGKIVEENPQIVEMDLNPVFVYEDGYTVVDARVVENETKKNEDSETGSESNRKEIHRFFYPESVVVFGSLTPPKAGFNIVFNLINLKYIGRIYPVNPKGGEILGLKAYKSVFELPETPDVAVIATPANTVPGVIEDCAKKGIKNVVIISSGFREESEKGAELEDRILEIARNYGMRIIGPNTTGVYNPETGFTSSFGLLRKINRGNIGIIAQTGLFLGILMNHAASAHPSIGFSKIAGLGNKCDVQDYEILDYMIEDESTKVIGMYIEGFKDGKRFFESAKRAEHSDIPLVVFKSGRTEYGKKMALSHTASLAGSDEIFEGVSRQANIIRVFSYEEMLETLKALSLQPLPEGRRIAIVHYVGSGCVQGADEAYFGGLELPEMSADTVEKIRTITPEWHRIGNPFDIWPSIEYFGIQDAYNTTIEAILQDDRFDCVVVGTWAGNEFYSSYQPPFEKLAKYGKPIYFFVEGDRDSVFRIKNEFEQNGFPVYPDIVTAIRILSKIVNYSVKKAERRKVRGMEQRQRN